MRFVFRFELAGVPVGRVTLEPTERRYRTEHFFRRGARAVVEVTVPEGALGASFALLKPRAPGCTPVVDEVSGKRGELCVEKYGTGTLFGEPFTAQYDARGLASLTLGASRFVRDADAPAVGDPFASGFPLTGVGALKISPAWPKSERVTPAGVPGATPGDCLATARDFVATHAGAAVELGLVEDDGRAWPHAWVKTKTGERIDPSAATPFPQYLALPNAGAAYVELLAGKRRVSRAE